MATDVGTGVHPRVAAVVGHGKSEKCVRFARFGTFAHDMGDGRRDGPATEINRTLGTMSGLQFSTDSAHVCIS